LRRGFEPISNEIYRNQLDLHQAMYALLHVLFLRSEKF
jgi:hypothetical protein